jgi:hypothetical protein
MWRLFIVIAIAWGAFAGAAQAQGGRRLMEIRTARSVTAEAGAIAGLRARGTVSETYASVMLDEAGKELESAAKTAAKEAPDLSPLIARAQEGVRRRDADALRGVAERLFLMEGAHGRAD